jgi:type I restriction enzyme M protein
MNWIAPSQKDAATNTLEKRLWDAADQFRANSGLKAQEYSGPILGLIFSLRRATRRAGESGRVWNIAPKPRRRRVRIDDPAYHAEGILYLPPETRFNYLLHRPGCSGATWTSAGCPQGNRGGAHQMAAFAG